MMTSIFKSKDTARAVFFDVPVKSDKEAKVQRKVF